jgi:hypothetical protein
VVELFVPAHRLAGLLPKFVGSGDYLLFSGIWHASDLLVQAAFVGAAKGLSAHFTASVLGDRPYRIQGIGSRSCRSDPDGFHPLVAVRASVHGLPPFCLDNGQLELRFQ